ncbi:Hypothetical protein POVN_LOCUS523 [uncultured virus]|nr:Hypothetical protein POVN_LOCUS523 [uncultured virus]
MSTEICAVSIDHSKSPPVITLVPLKVTCAHCLKEEKAQVATQATLPLPVEVIRPPTPPQIKEVQAYSYSGKLYATEVVAQLARFRDFCLVLGITEIKALELKAETEDVLKKLGDMGIARPEPTKLYQTSDGKYYSSQVDAETHFRFMRVSGASQRDKDTQPKEVTVLMK